MESSTDTLTLLGWMAMAPSDFTPTPLLIKKKGSTSKLAQISLQTNQVSPQNLVKHHQQNKHLHACVCTCEEVGHILGKGYERGRMCKWVCVRVLLVSCS